MNTVFKNLNICSLRPSQPTNEIGLNATTSFVYVPVVAFEIEFVNDSN